MKNGRWLSTAALILFATSSGCSLAARTLMNGIVENLHTLQYDDGRAQGGLTRAERRARFEESSIRSTLREQAYLHDGLPPLW